MFETEPNHTEPERGRAVQCLSQPYFRRCTRHDDAGIRRILVALHEDCVPDVNVRAILSATERELIPTYVGRRLDRSVTRRRHWRRSIACSQQLA